MQHHPDHALIVGADLQEMAAPERAHLFTLAGLASPAEKTDSPKLDDTLRRLVHMQHPNPAYVTNPWWDLLAYNGTYATLLGGLDDRPAIERNNAWLIFTDDYIRTVYGFLDGT
jgi:MmyB-like transcription regulator ligand binding domain